MSTSTARRQEDRSPERSYVSSQHTRTNADEAGRGESAQDELRGNSEHDPLLKDAVGVDNEFSLDTQQGQAKRLLPHSEERVSSSLSNAHEDVEKGGKTTVPIDDYNGPNDPLNPWNWPIAKRYLHIFPAAYCAFVATLGSSIYTPSYSEMMQIYGISTTVAILPMSLYVLSLSFGPMLFAPLSERYGRQVIFLTTLPLATLFTICGSFTTSFAAFCLCRFFSGFFFSPPIAVGAGCVTDLFPPEMRSKATVPTVLAPFLGPALGPVIGSYVTVAKGWKWVQYTMVLFALFGSLVCGLTDETHKGTILRRRNVTLGLPSPYPDLGKTRVERLRQWSVVVIWKPIDMLLLEPIVGFFSLYTAFNFGVLFMFFASFPYVFTTEYGFSKTENGLVFLSIAVGVFLGLPIVGICNKTLYMPKFEAAVQAKRDELSAGENTDSDAASIGSIVIAPEYRLYSAMIGSIILPIGLFWFAWTARSNITWVSPVLAAMPFAMGNLLIFISCCLYLADVYGMQGMASSLAANGVLRYVFGAAFPLFTLQMYEKLGIEWASSVLGFIGLALLPIPWVLFKFGPQIRAKSRFPVCRA